MHGLPITLLLSTLGGCTGAAGPPDTAAADPTDSADTATDTAGDTAAPLPPLDAPIVVYAVRHAEKDDEGSDPGLTEEGLARAEALAIIMADAPLAAIYATDLVRTQQTVQPTADDHGLPVETTLDPGEELAAWILATHAGDTVLHAGHSYTLGGFMWALGATDAPSVSGYGQLFTLTVAVDRTVSVEESTFGE